MGVHILVVQYLTEEITQPPAGQLLSEIHSCFTEMQVSCQDCSRLTAVRLNCYLKLLCRYVVLHSLLAETIDLPLQQVHDLFKFDPPALTSVYLVSRTPASLHMLLLVVTTMACTPSAHL